MNDLIKLPAQEWLGYDPERGDIHGYTFEQIKKYTKEIVFDILSELTNDDALGEARIETIKRIAKKYGVTR